MDAPDNILYASIKIDSYYSVVFNQAIYVARRRNKDEDDDRIVRLTDIKIIFIVIKTYFLAIRPGNGFLINIYI